MASIAVLPILIGLAVDYAIQFQSRVAEARQRTTAPRPPSLGRPRSARRRSRSPRWRPATGFLVLLLSPVPMVQGFGLLLVVGIAVALACALTAGLGRDRALRPRWRRARRLVARRRRDPPRRRRADSPAGQAPPGGCLPRAPCALGRRGGCGRRGPWGRRGCSRAPCRIRAACWRSALVLAVLGWVADTQTAVQSDVTKLVPSSMPALRDLRTLERVTGVSGEIDVTVHARERGDAADRRLDDPLRAGTAHALRLSRDQGLRARDAVPGAVAA